jgi:hypothetical protein
MVGQSGLEKGHPAAGNHLDGRKTGGRATNINTIHGYPWITVDTIRG